MSIVVTLPDGSKKEYPAQTTMYQIADAIHSGLRKQAIAAKVDGRLVDLNSKLCADAEISIITRESEEGLHIYRHSTAHLLAQAVKRIYGSDYVSLGVGPVIEAGFYYDMDLGQSITIDDLSAIEREMTKIVQEDWPIVRKEVSRAEAERIFREDPYKLELIRELPQDEVISIYEQGEFVDLCRGPHVPSTGKLKVFKLMSVAGAYWRGNSDRKMLQRIYGTAFPKKSQLDEHLHLLEEAKKRDHRKLGKELELFMFSDDAPGMPFFLPKGMIIRTELEQFTRGLQFQREYDEVRTPLMMNQRLWEISGHWDHYKDNMYFTQVDETAYALKPMNCPGHMLIYKNALHSYRELPIRISEFGQVHRHEFSGALNGMMRVRSLCQDDAHIFVRPDQILEEIQQVIELIGEVYKVFGFEYSIELSTRPEDSMGSDELWEQAESSLKQVLEQMSLSYRLNEGDGAFYGPKIDFHIRDSLKRSWQCGTIQLDFQFPEKFDLSYIGEDGQKHRPVVIHRAIFGSMERFIGILTEHYGGSFPLWLAPTQVMIIPVSDQDLDYSLKVKQLLAQAGMRVDMDIRTEKLGYKIREAGLNRIPYTFVLGEQERDADRVAVRKRGEGDVGVRTVEEMLAVLGREISMKK
ncbi:threonine--tRNA ligase [Paenibacillus sp. JCM 10914]|uniref:threonine--tRNA ligase n=1 Tax=Paenibacillus sp. JCM 10914 TaxID=1236974 RepID=UPI0003CC68F2|nr:threonine--tRNA ligase [Paenibacillus sp. JCM 10914]GAE05545.1 threonyl-tRNA synthetase [Paenibacillus sp. JCM 10914]